MDNGLILAKWQRLKEDAAEICKATLKVGIAGVPALLSPEHAVAMAFVGALAAELVGTRFTQRESERVDYVLTDFTRRIANLEFDQLQERLKERSFQDLLESGCYEAARTQAQNKLEGIANLLALGIKPQSNASLLKSYLAIYGRLDDTDLLLIEAIYEEDLQCQERNNKKLEEESIMANEEGSVSMATLSRLSHKFHSEIPLPDHVVFVSPLAQNSVQRLLTETLIKPTNNRMPETYSLTSLGTSFMRKIKGHTIHLELA